MSASISIKKFIQSVFKVIYASVFQITSLKFGKTDLNQILNKCFFQDPQQYFFSKKYVS